jgi:hypothetical protein
LKTVTLTKPWAGYTAGTILQVDDLRAIALDHDGFLDPLAALPEKKDKPLPGGEVK